MQKEILQKDQIHDFIAENTYRVKDKDRFLARDIDGRYKNIDDLSPLAIPGADIGQIAIVVSAGNTFGFEVNIKKVFEGLINIVDGVKNFHIDSDCEENSKKNMLSCGHWTQIKLDPTAYHLTLEQVIEIEDLIGEARKKGAQEVILKGEHMEGAVIQARGNYSIKTRYLLETARGTKEVGAFVYHDSLVKERHKKLAQELILNKAVKLYNGLDADYLYDVLTDMTEDHLFETVKRLAGGLPVYNITFKDDETFDVEEMGRV